MPLPYDIQRDMDARERAQAEMLASDATLADPSLAPPDLTPPSLAIVPGAEMARTRGPIVAQPTVAPDIRRDVPMQMTTPDTSARSDEMPFDFRRALLSFAGGDVGAYDQRQQQWQNRGFNQANQDLTLQGKRGELEDANLQRQNARALVDPTSPQSKQAQQMFADYATGLSNAPGMPAQLSEQLKTAASNAWNMTASQIAQAKDYYDRLFGNTLKAVGEQNRANLSGENMDLRREGVAAQKATAEATERLAAERLGLSWAEFQERKRHNLVEEDRRDNKVVLPPQQAMRAYNQRQVSLKEIARIKELMRSGKIRYTGKGANWLNSLFSVVPGAVDPRNKEEIELAGLIKRLRAPERKNIYGAALSKFDIQDSGQFMADIEQNPQTLMTNLGTLESALADENAMTEDTYPSLVGGGTLERSPGDAGAFKGAQAKPRTETPAAAPQQTRKTPAGAKVGNEYDYKDGSTWVVQPDMTMKRVK